MVMMQKVFADAAETIRKYGWIKKRLGCPQDGFCIAGALDYALASAQLRGPAANFPYFDALTEKLGRHESIAEWNDRSGRTKEEVLAVLDELGSTS